MGAEVPSWAKLLISQGVKHLGVSYSGLRKRLPKTKEYLVSEHFPEGSVFLDSGGFTANKEPDSHTLSEWRIYNEEYIDFVENNIDALDTVSEFDCLALGPAFMREMRDEFWDGMPKDKFLPIWHEQFGIKDLESLAEKYPRVGVTDATLKGSLNLTPRLNQLVQKYNTRLHGIAMTKPDELRDIKFESVSSTSWLSPSKYGDSVGAETLIWGRDTDGTVFCEQIGLLWHRAKKFEVRTVDLDGRVCWLPATAWQHQISPDKKIYRVSLQGGRSVVMTGDHNVFRLLDAGQVENVLSSSLRTGDRLMAAPPELGNSSKGLTLVKRGGKSIDLNANDIAEFLGLWVADGHLDKGSVGISKMHQPDCVRVVEHMANSCDAKIGYRPNGFDARIHSVPLVNAMREAGFSGGSVERTIPPLVFSWNRFLVSSFLRGLFSGDGSCTDHTVVYFSRSCQLIQQISTLLEGFDVLATTHETMSRTPSGEAIVMYSLEISDHISVNNYLNEIGFLQTRLVTPRPSKKIGNNSRRYQSSSTPTQARWDRVTKLEQVIWRPDMYDLSVPGAERFWANGLIVHNTIVWDTNKLVRYPVKYKEQSRLRHSALFARAGFDAEKIKEDDSIEVLKFTIWSWKQLEFHLNKSKNLTLLLGKRDEVSDEPYADIDPIDPVNSALEVHNKGGSVNRAPDRREPEDYRLLPVLQFKDMEVEQEDGTTAIEQVAIVNSRSMRVCDSCALADICPEFRPGFECAFKFPIELRTPKDYKQAMDGLLEAQMGRAMFGKMSEDMRGGYPDPNVSQEFDRFFKMAKLAKEIQDSGNYVKITAEGRGAGVFSKFFGGDMEQKINPPVLEPKNLAETDHFLGGIIEAEVIDGEN